MNNFRDLLAKVPLPAGPENFYNKTYKYIHEATGHTAMDIVASCRLMKGIDITELSIGVESAALTRMMMEVKYGLMSPAFSRLYPYVMASNERWDDKYNLMFGGAIAFIEENEIAIKRAAPSCQWFFKLMGDDGLYPVIEYNMIWIHVPALPDSLSWHMITPDTLRTIRRKDVQQKS